MARPRAAPFPPHRPAFTLVELLVVVGILAALVGLLLPTVGRARDSARSAVCLSNLRQLHASLTSFAAAHGGRVPIGHRTKSKQFNSMVYSTTAGGRWVLFGQMWRAKDVRDPRVLFCPAEQNPKFDFDTGENPWPAGGATPGQNVQAGYALRPDQELPDDPANPPPTLAPFGGWPRLSAFGGRAVLADLTAARARVTMRHRTGVNVVRGDGSGGWVPLSAFDRPAAEWPEPAFPPTDAYNATQSAIWWAFDGG